MCVCVHVFVQNNFEWQVVFSSTLPENYLTIPILNILYHRASIVAQSIKNLPAVQETEFDLWVGKIPWRRK